MSDPVGLSDSQAAALCAEPDKEATKGFFLQQTMMRVRDPSKTLQFYTSVLGMRLLTKLDFPAMTFTLYFLGYAEKEDIPTDQKERTKWAFRQPGTLEFTHNWGTEDSDKEYHNGNSEPRGFGHIGISVPDVYAASKRFEELGVKFIKKPNDGKMKGLAFIQDPDGYWIEILNYQDAEF